VPRQAPTSRFHRKAEALDVLEYANIAGGSAWSDARRANGREEPYGITMWCLGNEMDGPCMG
jgi:alpha-N-arabinofuranosidase